MGLTSFCFTFHAKSLFICHCEIKHQERPNLKFSEEKLKCDLEVLVH